MPEGHDTIIEVSNIMSFVLYTQILKQSVPKPASPGITLINEYCDECKVEFNCNDCKDRISCFYAMHLIAINCFTLDVI